MGSLMTFPAFASVSLDDKVADGFGDHVLFQFTRVRGVRIRALSQLPEEAEVLVPPPSVYRIVAVAMFHGSLVVTLERVDSPLTYLASPPALLASAAPFGGGAPAPLSPAPRSDVLDPELEALADSLVTLKVGLKKACVMIAEALCQEGVMCVQDLGDVSDAEALDVMSKAGMSKIQQNKVIQAVALAPLALSPPATALASSALPSSSSAAVAINVSARDVFYENATSSLTLCSFHLARHQPFWTCRICTFHNANMSSQNCSVCQSSRKPASVPSASLTPPKVAPAASAAEATLAALGSGSTLLQRVRDKTKVQQFLSLMNTRLPGKGFRLLYRWSSDGRSVASFHARCDNQVDGMARGSVFPSSCVCA